MCCQCGYACRYDCLGFLVPQRNDWHSPASFICSSQTLGSFQKQLKTQLFQCDCNKLFAANAATLIHFHLNDYGTL